MNRSATLAAATRNRHLHAIATMDRLGLTQEARTVLAILLGQLKDAHDGALRRLLGLAYSGSLDGETRRVEDALAILGHAMNDDAFAAAIAGDEEGGAA